MRRFLGTSFVTTIGALGLLVHQSVWLSAAVVWSYMLCRLVAKNGRGEQNRGWKTRELYMGLYLVVFAFCSHQQPYLILAITQVIYALSRGNSKKMARPANLVIR